MNNRLRTRTQKCTFCFNASPRFNSMFNQSIHNKSEHPMCLTNTLNCYHCAPIYNIIIFGVYVQYICVHSINIYSYSSFITIKSYFRVTVGYTLGKSTKHVTSGQSFAGYNTHTHTLSVFPINLTA